MDKTQMKFLRAIELTTQLVISDKNTSNWEMFWLNGAQSEETFLNRVCMSNLIQWLDFLSPQILLGHA